MIVFIDGPEVHVNGHTNTAFNMPGSALSSECISTPHGFTVTAFAFEEFLTYNALHYKLHSLMHSLDSKNGDDISDVVSKAQLLLLGGTIPPGLGMAIVRAYKKLGINEPVVVHAHIVTASDQKLHGEDAGHSNSDPTICGEKNVLASVQNCFASLYTADAIRYRQGKQFVHDKASLCVTVQKMIRLPNPAHNTSLLN